MINVKNNTIELNYKDELLAPLSIIDCYNTLCRKIKLALTKLEIYDDKANRIANLIAVKYSFKFYNYLQRKKDFEPIDIEVDLNNKEMIIYESLQLPLGDKVHTLINL